MQKPARDWGDLEEDDAVEEEELPPPEITVDEKTGIKTVVEHRVDPGVGRVKVTTKIRTVSKVKTVSSKVAARAHLQHFGTFMRAFRHVWGLGRSEEREINNSMGIDVMMNA